MMKMHSAHEALRAAVGVQAPFELIDVAGTQVAVARRGQGVPVLCLHATAHGGRDFEALSHALVPLGFEIVCVDWPGHGASPADATGAKTSAERYGMIVLALIPRLFGSKKPIVIGNSIGGAAALIAGLDRPDTVAGLVLCNPGGLAPIDGLARMVIGALVSFFKAGQRGAFWFPAAFGLYYKLVLQGREANTQRARIIAAGPAMAGVLVDAWESFARPEANLIDRARNVQVPTLFAWALGDQLVAWSRSREAVRAIPAASVRFYHGGHAAFLEDPAAFQADFLAFSRKLGQ